MKVPHLKFFLGFIVYNIRIAQTLCEGIPALNCTGESSLPQETFSLQRKVKCDPILMRSRHLCR